MRAELEGRREAEVWIARVRLGAFVFALFQVAIFSDEYPAGYEAWAWATTAALGIGAVLFWWLSRRELPGRTLARVGLVALAFDTAIVSSYTLAYSFEPGTPIRQVLFIPLVEAAFRYGLRGGIVLPIVLAPVFATFEWIRDDRLGSFQLDNVTFQIGVQVIAGLIVGWLVNRLAQQTEVAEVRAAEAERFRDQLGHRVDVLEAANRCSRALASSLELEQAFNAFIRELRGLVPFDRTAIVLAEDGSAEVIATAGRGADTVFPPGSAAPVTGTVLEQVLRGQTVYRRDLTETLHVEEAELVELGLRSELASPLLLGPRAIGMLAISRAEPRAFSAEEVELVSLLGRLVATAVQNLRAYEAERQTVGELRRLSAMRADFVSLVSHELRSPMAAVIGAARTLHDRWRELSSEQRESFLALIADETNRLSALIGDVLDTSRIESGAFSYSFSDVDVGELVREVVAAAEVGQDEVSVDAIVREPLPRIRGDHERLRQVVMNLLDNAVKYSAAAGAVRVAAFSRADEVLVEVTDDGPGIAREHQRVIFEKFGRVKGAAAKPGTGLGLFIARSIAEAHGGTLTVRSLPDRGATFTLALPAGAKDARAGAAA